MKTWYVYGHWTKDTNELFYIGVGTGNRCKVKSNRNNYWNNIVDKHDYDIHIIIGGFLDRDDAVKEEVRLQIINKPKACLQYGDKMNSIISEETRRNMSKAQIGNKANLGKKFTEEHKRKMSETKYKQIINCRGEIYKSLKEATEFYNFSGHSIIGANLTGRRKTGGKYPDGTRIVWIYYTEGDCPPSSCILLNNHRNKSVVNCRGEIYLNLTEASKAYNLKTYSSITNAINGNAKSAGKYLDGTKIKWRYHKI